MQSPSHRRLGIRSLHKLSVRMDTEKPYLSSSWQTFFTKHRTAPLGDVFQRFYRNRRKTLGAPCNKGEISHPPASPRLTLELSLLPVERHPSRPRYLLRPRRAAGLRSGGEICAFDSRQEERGTAGVETPGGVSSERANDEVGQRVSGG